MFQTKDVEKIKTHILCSWNPPPPSSRKSSRLWDNLLNYCEAGQAADDNMAHAYCILSTFRLQTHLQNM